MCHVHWAQKKREEQEQQQQKIQSSCLPAKKKYDASLENVREKDTAFIQKFLNDHKEKFSTIESLKPRKLYRFDPVKIERFVDSKENKAERKAFRAFMDLSQKEYVSWPTFVRMFALALDQFLHFARSRPFLLLAPRELETKSNIWMSHIACTLLQKRKRLPVAVVTTTQAILDWPDVPDVLVVDDAMFSGSQMSAWLSNRLEDVETRLRAVCKQGDFQRFKRVSVVVAYTSNDALYFVKRCCTNEFTSRLHIFYAKVMRPVTERLQEEEYRYIEVPDKFPMLFAHKVPDHQSSFPQYYRPNLDDESPSSYFSYYPTNMME